jgi:hypothetical protein
MEGPATRSVSWPIVVVVLGATLAVAIVGGTLYVLKRAADVPRDLAEQGRQALKDVRSIAEAFRTGTITTSFTSYATEVSASSYLQFATLKQVEVFQRKDTATLLWGELALPDVVVEARAPVTYTYYLDLSKRWTLRQEGNTVLVTAPAIEFNTPAIDASAIRFEVREGSLFRNEGLVVDALKAGLTAMSKQKAQQNVALVREAGRHQTEAFVERWLVNGFSDGPTYHARVVFADEPPAPPPLVGLPAPKN